MSAPALPTPADLRAQADKLKADARDMRESAHRSDDRSCFHREIAEANRMSEAAGCLYEAADLLDPS